MNLIKRVKNFIKSKKGNSLLLATVGAISATFGAYFFVAITTLSEDNKQRVTHLYNSYTIGVAVEAKINGTDESKTRLNNTEIREDIEEQINLVFHDGSFITLQDMIDHNIIAVGDDPTATDRLNDDTPYDLENSGALITYVDAVGDVIAEGDSTPVDDVLLLVNLAGTADAIDASNAPYTAGDPFYYVLMDDSQMTTTGLDTTIDTDTYNSILSSVNGGPQAETSVILPQDNE